MKNYELLAIYKPSLDSEELDKEVEKFSNEIKSYEGSVISVDKMGRKKLAYDIQGYRDGFFTVAQVTMPAEKIVKLNENVIRFMFMENSKKVQAV